MVLAKSSILIDWTLVNRGVFGNKTVSRIESKSSNLFKLETIVSDLGFKFLSKHIELLQFPMKEPGHYSGLSRK